MTDLNKRATLKAISAATTIAAVPTLASAASNACLTPTRVGQASGQATGIELSFSGHQIASMQTVTITNASKEPATLRHISPGLVKSGDQVFDVNDLLVDGPVTMSPGESGSFALSPVDAGLVERRTPSGTIANEPLTVTTTYQTLSGDKSVTTQRMCLS